MSSWPSTYATYLWNLCCRPDCKRLWFCDRATSGTFVACKMYGFVDSGEFWQYVRKPSWTNACKLNSQNRLEAAERLAIRKGQGFGVDSFSRALQCAPVLGCCLELLCKFGLASTIPNSHLIHWKENIFWFKKSFSFPKIRDWLIRTGFAIDDNNIQSKQAAKRDECGGPIHQKHDGHAKNGSN